MRRNGRGLDEVFTETEVVAVDGIRRSFARASSGDPVRQEFRDLWLVQFDVEGRGISFESGLSDRRSSGRDAGDTTRPFDAAQAHQERTAGQRFGGSLRSESKSDADQINEVLCNVIAHNPCEIIAT